MSDTYKLSQVISQLDRLIKTYDLDLYDLSDIRELSYREGYSELYHLVSESPTKYFYEVLNKYE